MNIHAVLTHTNANIVQDPLQDFYLYEYSIFNITCRTQGLYKNLNFVTFTKKIILT